MLRDTSYEGQFVAGVEVHERGGIVRDDAALLDEAFNYLFFNRLDKT